MRKEDVATGLSNLAFDFFYWFSRFEFALKANGYLTSHEVGHKADPGWTEFFRKWESTYSASVEAQYLLASPPERQIELVSDKLDWRPVGHHDFLQVAECAILAGR